MYRKQSKNQRSFENFALPFGGKLSGENRWVKLAELVPWDEYEESYSSHFSNDQGIIAKSFRVALGALLIKERLGCSDRETVLQIQENPYLQYFLGFSCYSDKAPFDASMMVHFRKRLTVQVLNDISKHIAKESLCSGVEEKSKDDDSEPPSSGPNQGKLLLDATCAPADIAYPTDLKLLNECRLCSEKLIDLLCAQETYTGEKPRNYREKARKQYLVVAKKRVVNGKALRKAKRQQLQYIRRNLNSIDKLLDNESIVFEKLPDADYRRLLIIREVYRQQQLMFDLKQKRIDDRIVSISQPHVRPIVRGKAGAHTEFGAKLSASSDGGFVYLDRVEWDAFNESTDFVMQVESYRKRHGHYPESVHADKIYRTRANRNWCKERGIRLSGPKLGRPAKSVSVQEKKQQREDEGYRNRIEGTFGNLKRKYSLARIMTKLAHTSEVQIGLTFLAMNLDVALRRILLFLAHYFVALQRRMNRFKPQYDIQTT